MELTLQEAKEFVDSVPWREVQWRKPGSGMDQHWYVIVGWEQVPADHFWAFVRFVKREGYRGRYTRQDGTVTTNSYVEIGEFVYWTIPPSRLAAPGSSTSSTSGFPSKRSWRRHERRRH